MRTCRSSKTITHWILFLVYLMSGLLVVNGFIQWSWNQMKVLTDMKHAHCCSVLLTSVWYWIWWNICSCSKNDNSTNDLGTCWSQIFALFQLDGKMHSNMEISRKQCTWSSQQCSSKYHVCFLTFADLYMGLNELYVHGFKVFYLQLLNMGLNRAIVTLIIF